MRTLTCDLLAVEAAEPLVVERTVTTLAQTLTAVIARQGRLTLKRIVRAPKESHRWRFDRPASQAELDAYADLTLLFGCAAVDALLVDAARQHLAALGCCGDCGRSLTGAGDPHDFYSRLCGCVSEAEQAAQDRAAALIPSAEELEAMERPYVAEAA